MEAYFSIEVGAGANGRVSAAGTGDCWVAAFIGEIDCTFDLLICHCLHP